MTHPKQKGFSYLILMFAIAVMGLVLSGLGQVWHIQLQREKEAELLDIGRQFSAALESYRKVTPPGAPDAPGDLSDLLTDKRFPYPVHHLRKLFRDPFSGEANWQIHSTQNRIIGISSTSERHPLRQVESLPKFVTVNKTSRDNEIKYSDWMFVRAVR